MFINLIYFNYFLYYLIHRKYSRIYFSDAVHIPVIQIKILFLLLLIYATCG